jgi:iron-sulfur cluster repair protein YtfE (RIC family)
MNAENTLPRLLKTVESDHELISEFIQNTSKLLARGSPQAAPKAAATLRRFVSKKLVHHFTAEERRIFPALVKSDRSGKTARAVARLQKEHAALLKQAERVDQLLAASDAGDGAAARKELLDFFHKLRGHSLKEDKLFPSLI